MFCCSDAAYAASLLSSLLAVQRMLAAALCFSVL
eukprot:COSAG06_NODE_64002_length_260_cov_2.167702_2_plen_33_part_01